MLVLNRKRGEAVVIGRDVTIRVLEVHGKRVKLGLNGPAEVPIYRKEVSQKIGDRPPSPDDA